MGKCCPETSDSWNTLLVSSKIAEVGIPAGVEAISILIWVLRRGNRKWGQNSLSDVNLPHGVTLCLVILSDLINAPEPPSTKQKIRISLLIDCLRFDPYPTKDPKKKIPPTITLKMSAAIRYCLLRTPAVHVVVPRITARSFTTSQILRRETVTVPKKRPVGAFRGGYVSAEPYWGWSVDSGAGCNALRYLSGRREKNMKHQREVWYDRWTDILKISSIGSSDFSWAQPSQELLLIFISSMNIKSPMSC